VLFAFSGGYAKGDMVVKFNGLLSFVLSGYL